MGSSIRLVGGSILWFIQVHEIHCLPTRHNVSQGENFTYYFWSSQVGFYLGYLRGRNFPPPPKKKLRFPPKILLSLKNVSNYSRSEKSSRRQKDSTHEVSIPCLRTLYDKEYGVLETACLTAGSVTPLYILFMS